MAKIIRSPLSKAEHDFLESEKAKGFCNSRTLFDYEDSNKCLKNRIREAFIAGWEACEKDGKLKRIKL